jgi:hypothetical protein
MHDVPAKPMNARQLFSRTLFIVGNVAMVAGALDLMEGSLLILPGSALVLLATWIGRAERSFIAYRVWVFILIAVGVAAFWRLNSLGGFGGNSGRSGWWGLMILPYLIGWSMAMWGPGSPRWLLVLGILVGVFYEVMVLALLKGPMKPGTFVIGVLGLVTIIGCITRFIHRTPQPLPTML